MVKKTISRYCPFKVLWDEPQRPSVKPAAHAVQAPASRRSNLGPCPGGDLLHLQHGGAGRHEPLVHVLPAAVQDDGHAVQLPGHLLCHPVVLQPAPAHPLSQLQARRSWYYHHDGECIIWGLHCFNQTENDRYWQKITFLFLHNVRKCTVFCICI